MMVLINTVRSETISKNWIRRARRTDPAPEATAPDLRTL